MPHRGEVVADRRLALVAEVRAEHLRFESGTNLGLDISGSTMLIQLTIFGRGDRI
jgi:hypothetical protein